MSLAVCFIAKSSGATKTSFGLYYDSFTCRVFYANCPLPILIIFTCTLMYFSICFIMAFQSLLAYTVKKTEQ